MWSLNRMDEGWTYGPVRNDEKKEAPCIVPYEELPEIGVTLIANLLLSVLQSKLSRRWSFSGLATIVRIVLMYYLHLEKFLNQPDADLKIMLAEASESPPEPSLFG